MARLFASQAALALAEAHRADQMRQALSSRDVIGQAKGILMERHRITADEAFGLLSKHSQRVEPEAGRRGPGPGRDGDPGLTVRYRLGYSSA